MPTFSTIPAEIEAEIRALPITHDPLPSPREGEMTEGDKQLSESLFYDSQEGNPRAISQLKRLIAKYPDVPALKNHLTVAYLVAGRTGLADRLNEQLRRENPEYLFGHLNHASKLLKDEDDWARIPEVLGETLRLAEMMPEVELFHFSEVRDYYNLVARFHLRAGNPDVAGAILRILEEIVGADDERLDGLRLAIARYNLERIQQLMAEEDARAIHVVVAEPPEPPTEIDSPEFLHPEIGALYKYGFDMPLEIIRGILDLPKETLITDLEAVLRDGISHGSFFLEAEAVDDEETYFPMHALFFLGELRACDSLPRVFDMLSQHPRLLEFWFGDLIYDKLWEPLYYLVEGQLEAARNFLCSPGIPKGGRGVVAIAVAQVALHQSERRAEIIAWFGEVFETIVNLPAEDNVLDTDLVTSLTNDMLDLRATELLPLIQAAYEKGYIAASMVGDLEEIERSLDEPVTGRERRGFLRLSQRYADLGEKLGGGADGGFESPPAATALPQVAVGRNDPCPCGSGKKYKKCCLNN